MERRWNPLPESSRIGCGSNGIKSQLPPCVGYCDQPNWKYSAALEATGYKLKLRDIKKTIWLTRPDLRELFGSDHDGFSVWLAVNGVKEYRALQEFEYPLSEDFLTEAAPEALPEVQPTLTRFMKAVWSTRPDLRATFDLRTFEGQQGFIWWYFIYGIGELNLSRFLTVAQRKHLNDAEPQLPSGGWLPITRLMLAVWRHRPDLQQAFDLTVAQNHNAFLAWYFTHGVKELKLAQTVDNHQADFLLTPLQSGLETILSLLWSADEGLQKKFNSPNDDAYRQWATSDNGHLAYPILRRLAELSEQPKHEPNLVHTASLDLIFGVNLIGYAKGQLGIGEDVRMAALALKAAGIPFSIYNVEPGRDGCQGDNSAVQHISDALPYSINLFCTTGIETARLAAVEGSKLFDGRHSIGYWPWELPEWPTDWHHAYSLVDEVWASSRFTYESFVRSSPKPVRHMPMAVTVDQTAGLTRGDFDLPGNRFLFVFSFDFLSHLARKNPQACVEAFRKAFPRGDEPVGLVVKAMRATSENPLWQALLAAAKADGRILVIGGTLKRGALLDLYRACDCFVSLHRSEGFGRGLVEAMMLEKPVIATGHSGNMDFTLPGTAGVVDHRLCYLNENEYPFGNGQIWAEPDIDHAAWWMSRMACNPAARQRLAKTAQILTINTYSPAVIGENYREVLCTLHTTRKSEIDL